MALLPNPVQDAINGIVTTDEELAAQAGRNKAAWLAESGLDFNKAVYADNNAAVDKLQGDIFGKSEEQLAQELANDRAKNGYNRDPQNGLYTFGDGGSFQNPAGKGAAPQTGTKGLPDGWSEPFNEATMREAYKDWQYEHPGGTYEEMVKRAHEANPEGRPMVSITNKDGRPGKRPATDSEMSQAQAKGYSTGQKFAQSNTQQAPITDIDRALAKTRAAQQYEQTLPGQFDASFGRRKNAVDSFQQALDGIKAVDAGEYDKSWDVDDKQDYISPEAKAAQSAAMGKTLALTDTKETAEEKLMREISRRKQEQQLRSSTEAQASQLRARGAYGSGAELSGFLGASQEAAQRRSLEELGADANAQKRAMEAIGQYSNQAFELGQQDLNQGMARDVNSRANSNSQQQFRQFRVKTQQQENNDLARREASKLDATNGLEDNKRNDINTVNDTKIRLLGAKTGTNLSGAQNVNTSSKDLAGVFNGQANRHEANAAEQDDWGGF